MRKLSSYHQAKFRPFAVFWILLAGGIFALLGVAVVAQLRAHSHTARSLYQGEVKAGRQNLPVVAPKSTWIDQILATEGDDVQAGQILASLNTFALELALETAEDDLLVTRFHRACLMADIPGKDLPVWTTDHPPEIQAKLQIAATQCEAERAALERPRQTNLTQVDLLRKRRALLQKYLTLLAGQSHDGTEAPARHIADRAVQILLAQNELQDQILLIERELSQSDIASAMQIVSRTRALTQQITKLHQQVERLKRLIEKPNLVAPATGVVALLSIPQPGRPLIQDTVVFEIEAANDPMLGVTGLVPARIKAGLVSGQLVAFKVTRADDQHRWFDGVLSDLPVVETEAASGFMQIRVQPDANDIDVLRKWMAQTGRSHNTMPTMIAISKDHGRLDHAVWDVISDSLKSGLNL